MIFLKIKKNGALFYWIVDVYASFEPILVIVVGNKRTTDANDYINNNGNNKSDESFKLQNRFRTQKLYEGEKLRLNKLFRI